MTERILIFNLGGIISEDDYQNYQDVKGVSDFLNKKRAFKSIVTNYPSVYSPEEFDTILIFPRNYYKFNNVNYPDFHKGYNSQLDFLDNLREIPEDKQPNVFCLFSDEDTSMLDNNYLDKHALNIIDPFKDIKFSTICDYICFCKNKHSAKDAFIHKDLQKHVKKQHIIRWTLLANLPKLREISNKSDYKQSDLFETDTLNGLDLSKINKFYYGNYDESVVDNLKSLDFGKNKNDLIIGDELFEDEFEQNYFELNNDLPRLELIKQLIQKAKYNLLFFDKASIHKITNKELELVVFNGNILNIDDCHSKLSIQDSQIDLCDTHDKLIEYLSTLEFVAEKCFISAIFSNYSFFEIKDKTFDFKLID